MTIREQWLHFKEHHELRREIEMNIDPDEEDPELYQYEDFGEEEKKMAHLHLNSSEIVSSHSYIRILHI